MASGHKRLKQSDDKETDRLSALPDSIIHHILSFLPSIKQAIRCGILSKRWRNQWTRLPVLILDPTGMSEQLFFQSTANILLSHACFNIKRFCITYLHCFKRDPLFAAKIRFATIRNVEDLHLNCDCVSGKYVLPEMLFDCSSLVKLRIDSCMFMPSGSVNWEHLKELNFTFCTFNNRAIESVLSGSPLLESLLLFFCDGLGQSVIASKSLKRLRVVSVANFTPDISCPGLEALIVMGGPIECVTVSNQALGNILSTSKLLKYLKLWRCDGLGELVIASNSVRRLVLKRLKVSAIEISCPNLEELTLKEVDNVGPFRLKNVPSAISAPSDLCVDWRAGSLRWRRFSSGTVPSTS